MARYWTLTADQLATLDRITLEYIATAYSGRRAGRPEPAITAAEVADYIRQHGGCPEPVRNVKRWTYAATYAALQRLRRAGALETSLAWVSGREARCYSPAAARGG